MKIVIDGSIGAGKSTQIDILSKVTGKNVIKEPIHEWPLDLFYQDPGRWGLTMQVAVLNSYIKMKPVEGILERCPESSRAVFWTNLVNTKVVTDREDQIYQALFETHAWEPDVTIFIEKTPEQCFKHIQKRKQEGDDGVTLEYLKDLHTLYQNYCKQNKNIYIINGNQSVKNVTADILKTIKPYIKQEEICPPDVPISFSQESNVK